MANNYRQRSGDRYDGRLIHTLPAFTKFLPFIMKTRNDAQSFYEQSFDVDNADSWLDKQQSGGYGGMSVLHLFIAAYVRCVAALPALNRFVSGRRIYARDSIEVVIPVRRGSGLSSAESSIKVGFEPTDTVFDVYNKIGKAVEELRAEDGGNRSEELAERFVKFPRFLVRFIVWLMNLADHLGLLPKKILDESPFHGSLSIVNLSDCGTGPLYHGIYNFGNLPMFMSLGAKRSQYETNGRGAAVERRLIDAKFALDARIVDSHYYAAAFRYMSKLINEPELLEIPPEVVREDIF